jgi:hypothetical protein
VEASGGGWDGTTPPGSPLGWALLPKKTVTLFQGLTGFCSFELIIITGGCPGPHWWIAYSRNRVYLPKLPGRGFVSGAFLVANKLSRSKVFSPKTWSFPKREGYHRSQIRRILQKLDLVAGSHCTSGCPVRTIHAYAAARYWHASLFFSVQGLKRRNLMFPEAASYK